MSTKGLNFGGKENIIKILLAFYFSNEFIPLLLESTNPIGCCFEIEDDCTVRTEFIRRGHVRRTLATYTMG